jgi:hypothetical protein
MNDLHYAVVVGIDRYPGISDLAGAGDDATQFAEWLQSPDGGALPEPNVHLLVGRAGGRPGGNVPSGEIRQDDVDDALHSVVQAVRTALRENRTAWERSRFYLYVAGHGFAPAGSEGAFLLGNARLGAYTRNIDLAKYRQWVSACAWFSEVAIFADCCRSRLEAGPIGSGPSLDGGSNPFGAREPGWVIGYATEAGGVAYEGNFDADDEARGHFTRALLTGLRGSAVDQTGAVTAASLRDYVTQLVADTTRDHACPQMARFPHDLPPSFVFRASAATPQRAKWRVKISFPRGYGGRIALRVDNTAITVHDATQGQLTIDLEDGLYEIAPDDEQPPAEFPNGGLFKVSGEPRHVQL